MKSKEILIYPYEKRRDSFGEQQHEFVTAMLHLDWNYYSEVIDYPDGILISPELADHKDWQDILDARDDESDPIFIDDLSGIFAGDNDWSKDIIEL